MYYFAPILVFTIIYLIVINKAFKNKTDLLTIGLLQLGIPWAFHIFVAVLIPNTDDPTWYPLACISFLVTLLLFGYFNWTEAWFRQKYRFEEERTVILNTLNNEPDGDKVNTYKPKFRESDQLDQLFQHNWDIITRLRGVDPFKKMIQHYYTLHPEKRDVIAAMKETQEKQKQLTKPIEDPPKSKKKKPQDNSSEAPTNEIAQVSIEVSIEEVKTESLLVFREIFEGFHFHVRYMRWYFFMDVDADRDLHDRLKIYILSPREVLPNVLNLNCAFLMDEFENGKKFSVMVAIEGYRIQSVIDKLNNLTGDLECLKFFPKFTELDRLQKRAEYWEQKAYDLAIEFNNLRKHDMTINSMIDIKTPHRKRKIPFLKGEIDANE